jgi:putative transposase
MKCIACGATAVSERPDRMAQGYRRFRCRECGKQFNDRGGGILNRTQYPSDVVALVVFWRLRYELSLRDLPEMFLLREIEFSHETVREWEAKLTPALIDHLRRRHGRIGHSWYVDETYIKVHAAGVICIGRSIVPERWWTFVSARNVTWRRRRRSFVPPGRSPA